MTTDTMDMLDSVVRSSGLDQELKPCRKRQRLDHLSPEEKLLRRKMKNRAAAQSARDRKKAHMDELEIEVDVLRQEKQRLAAENERLQKIVSDQAEQIEELQRRLAGADSTVSVARPAGRSTPTGTQEDVIIDEAFEHASPISGPQQKDQASLVMFVLLFLTTVVAPLARLQKTPSLPAATKSPKNSIFRCSTTKTSSPCSSISPPIPRMTASLRCRTLAFPSSTWTPHRLKT